MLAIIELIFLEIENLAVRLANVLAEHWDHLVSSLVVKSQQVYAKLVVDVLSDCLAFIMLLRGFKATSIDLGAF